MGYYPMHHGLGNPKSYNKLKKNKRKIAERKHSSYLWSNDSRMSFVERIDLMLVVLPSQQDGLGNTMLVDLRKIDGQLRDGQSTLGYNPLTGYTHQTVIQAGFVIVY